MENSQGIFVSFGQKDNRDQKQGFGMHAAVQTAKPRHALAILAHSSLVSDLVSRRDSAHKNGPLAG